MLRKALAALALVPLVWGAEEFEVLLEDMIEKTVPLRAHSLISPYVDSDLQNRWWDFGGTTIINTNKHVRLTQDKPSESGWLWNRMPLSASNFMVEFEFKVDGKAHNIFGDGFAVWLSKDRAKSGPVFGSVDYFTGLGLFFDTYANSKHTYSWPRISAMSGDGKTQYDHDHDNESHELAGCSEQFRRREIPTKGRLTYVKSKSRLLVELQTKKTDEWLKCFETSIVLPESPYLGFTALTGDVSDAHDIISINSHSVILKPQYRERGRGSPAQAKTNTPGAGQVPLDAKASKQFKKRASGGAASWFLFVLKLIGLVAFIAFAVAAVRTYNAQQNNRRHW